MTSVTSPSSLGWVMGGGMLKRERAPSLLTLEF
jgi:hypothetical protein